MLADDRERGMRQQGGAFQDHAIELESIVLGALGEDRHGFAADVGAIGIRHHFRHRHMPRQGLGTQQGLADAVAQRGVQAAAVESIGIDGSSRAAEVHRRSAQQPRPQLLLQELQMLVRVENRIAAGNAGEDDVGAIADGDLAIVEDQHHRDDRGRFHDRRHARLQGSAAIDEAVGLRARLDGKHVLVKEARRSGCEDDVGDSASAGAHDEPEPRGVRTAPSPLDRDDLEGGDLALLPGNAAATARRALAIGVELIGDRPAVRHVEPQAQQVALARLVGEVLERRTRMQHGCSCS